MSLPALANLTLTLAAIDSNSFAIAGALSVWITELPSDGSLYQTSDGVTMSSQITTVPTAVTHPSFIVIYANTAATAPYSEVPVLYNDAVVWQPQLTYNGTVIKSAVSQR